MFNMNKYFIGSREGQQKPFHAAAAAPALLNQDYSRNSDELLQDLLGDHRTILLEHDFLPASRIIKQQGQMRFSVRHFHFAVS